MIQTIRSFSVLLVRHTDSGIRIQAPEMCDVWDSNHELLFDFKTHLHVPVIIKLQYVV